MLTAGDLVDERIRELHSCLLLILCKTCMPLSDAPCQIVMPTYEMVDQHAGNEQVCPDSTHTPDDNDRLELREVGNIRNSMCRDRRANPAHCPEEWSRPRPHVR